MPKKIRSNKKKQSKSRKRRYSKKKSRKRRYSRKKSRKRTLSASPMDGGASLGRCFGLGCAQPAAAKAKKKADIQEELKRKRSLQIAELVRKTNEQDKSVDTMRKNVADALLKKDEVEEQALAEKLAKEREREKESAVAKKRATYVRESVERKAALDRAALRAKQQLNQRLAEIAYGRTPAEEQAIKEETARFAAEEQAKKEETARFAAEEQAKKEEATRAASKEQEPSGTNKIDCTGECYNKIYNPKCDLTTETCHEDVIYIWNILTDTDLKSTVYTDYYPVYFNDLKDSILSADRNSVYHIDLVCNLGDGRDVRILHTLIIEKFNSMYKIYQSYVNKYTINEWLNGELNNAAGGADRAAAGDWLAATARERRSDAVVKKLSPDQVKRIHIIKRLNDDNLELIEQFKSTVGDFGGPNCLPEGQIKKFLDLLILMLNKIHNLPPSPTKEINDISKQLFGPKLFDEDTKYNYVGRYKLINNSIQPTVFIRVKSSKTTCVDRTSK
jgi:chemotaxis protein histidine kinase CheA